MKELKAGKLQACYLDTPHCRDETAEKGKKAREHEAAATEKVLRELAVLVEANPNDPKWLGHNLWCRVFDAREYFKDEQVFRALAKAYQKGKPHGAPTEEPAAKSEEPAVQPEPVKQEMPVPVIGEDGLDDFERSLLAGLDM